MKKKKGFTLIELLAVIVILAIIALIAVPVIMNIISKARKSAFEDTAYGLISAGEMYYAEMLLEPTGMTDNVEFIFDENGNIAPSGLNIKGSIPTGKMTVTKEGKVALAVDNGIYCITKMTSESGITTNEKNGECDYKRTANPLFTTNDFATSVDVCTTNGQECQPGTKFAVQVNDTETYNFYVVREDTDGVLTLIMDSNLGDNVAWINEETYGCGVNENMCPLSDKGPLTALDVLEERTSGWTNLPKGYTTEDENTPAKYSPITRSNARARMVKKSEVNDILSGNDWLNNSDYWISTAHDSSYEPAWFMVNGGSIVAALIKEHYGLRPVIELQKSFI